MLKFILLEVVKYYLDVLMKLGFIEFGNLVMFECNMLKFDGLKNENFVKDVGDIIKEIMELGEVEWYIEGRFCCDMFYEYYVYINVF